MVITEEQLLFLFIFGAGIAGTWWYAHRKGYDEGYFTACAHVATGEIEVTAQEIDNERD